MSNGLTSSFRSNFRVVTTWIENSVCEIAWQLVENWLRNPRNSIILVDEFYVNLTKVFCWGGQHFVEAGGRGNIRPPRQNIRANTENISKKLDPSRFSSCLCGWRCTAYLQNVDPRQHKSRSSAARMPEQHYTRHWCSSWPKSHIDISIRSY